MGSGLVGLNLKSLLLGSLLTVSRNGLTVGGAVPLGSARPQMSNHQHIENKRYG